MADPILTLTDELRHFFNQELSRITDYEGNLVGYAMTVEQWRAFCATIDAIIARMVADAEERDSYDDRCYDAAAQSSANDLLNESSMIRRFSND